MTKHYYNEIDSYAAQWLRNLMLKGHLPRGDVDTPAPHWAGDAPGSQATCTIPAVE